MKEEDDGLRPQLLSCLRGYGREQLAADAGAGVIVGIVALPLAIAFAIASGVTPDRGLTTAIVAGTLISALGGSRVQIGGPTGAFVVVVYRIVQEHGLEGLTLATLLAGALLVAMGLMRLGRVIRYIPYPVTVGFTAGIALTILSSQLRDFFGLPTGPLPADFLERLSLCARAAGAFDPLTTALSLASLAIIGFWPRVNRKIPGSIVAVAATTALVHLLKLPVETVGSRFGALPAGLPAPHWPAHALARLPALARPAFTVALLGAIESLLSATVADGMIGARHRSNTELVAQGVANVGSALFGGIPATGAIARTATNVRNGGRTPVAGLVHAATLLAVMLALGRWAGLIPLCSLAAVLVVVCWHMSERHAFRAVLRGPRSDAAVLLTTFALTVLVDLTAGVEAGVLLALVLLLRRLGEVSAVRRVEGGAEDEGLPAPPEGVAVYEADGALVFGAVEGLRDVLPFGAKPPKALVLSLRRVVALDATAIRALADLHDACARQGTRFLLAGLRPQPRRALERAGFLARLGEGNVLDGELARELARLGRSG